VGINRADIKKTDVTYLKGQCRTLYRHGYLYPRTLFGKIIVKLLYVKKMLNPRPTGYINKERKKLLQTNLRSKKVKITCVTDCHVDPTVQSPIYIEFL
jgi:hypothetical protein